MREEKDSRVVPVMDSRNDGLHACVINLVSVGRQITCNMNNRACTLGRFKEQ